MESQLWVSAGAKPLFPTISLQILTSRWVFPPAAGGGENSASGGVDFTLWLLELGEAQGSTQWELI